MASMATTSRPKKTVDDFMALGDGVRAELIDGEIYMAASPTSWHQIICGNLHLAMAQHARERNLGTVFVAPLDVHLPSGDIVEPDLIFVAEKNRGIVQDWIRGVPDLLVEIVSPSNPERDRLVKRTLYQRNGVPEYWIVEPEARAIEILRLEPQPQGSAAFAPAGYVGAGATLITRALPELELQVDDVFRST